MQIEGLDFDKAWQRRQEHYYGEEKVYLLSLEDLISAKETAGRPQDLIDLENLKKKPLKKNRLFA